MLRRAGGAQRRRGSAGAPAAIARRRRSGRCRVAAAEPVHRTSRWYTGRMYIGRAPYSAAARSAAVRRCYDCFLRPALAPGICSARHWPVCSAVGAERSFSADARRSRPAGRHGLACDDLAELVRPVDARRRRSRRSACSTRSTMRWCAPIPGRRWARASPNPGRRARTA